MTTELDADRLDETAVSQARYFTAHPVIEHGFSWESHSDDVKHGRFLYLFGGVYRLAHFPGSVHEDLFVAWLRTGSNAVISHVSPRLRRRRRANES
ncbi:MAG TPA: hypothetical protein PLD25_30835 [Chloroflexota bacterium]|nr:hypothetical protein [Chloroflexota bacterium]HUM68907.1 hypothetical protein [Chloroflexota bacterium]